MRCYICRSI